MNMDDFFKWNGKITARLVKSDAKIGDGIPLDTPESTDHRPIAKVRFDIRTGKILVVTWFNSD